MTPQLPPSEEDQKQYLCRRLLNSPAESAYIQPEVVTGQRVTHPSPDEQEHTTHDSQTMEPLSQVAHQTHDESTHYGHQANINQSLEETKHPSSHLEPKRNQQESARRPAEQIEPVSAPPSSMHSTIYVTPSEDESQFSAIQSTTSNSYQQQSSQQQVNQQPRQAHRQQRPYQQQMYQHPNQTSQQQQLHHQQQQANQQQKSYQQQQASQQQQPFGEQARQLSSEKARNDAVDNSWVGKSGFKKKKRKNHITD